MIVYLNFKDKYLRFACFRATYSVRPVRSDKNIIIGNTRVFIYLFLRTNIIICDQRLYHSYTKMHYAYAGSGVGGRGESICADYLFYSRGVIVLHARIFDVTRQVYMHISYFIHVFLGLKVNRAAIVPPWA